MIPILYNNDETLFGTNGRGRLSDIISCKVTEERNGVYECEFEYPMTGAHYDEIIEGRMIAATHDEAGDVQPFIIYGHSAPIDGVVTFYAHHLSYRLSGMTVKPFVATTCAGALSALVNYSVIANPFSFSTDKNVTATLTSSTPRLIRPLLGGEQNSILDVYGTGEYEFDKFNVILHTRRGADKPIQIRYGKNLLELNDEINYSDSFTGIMPFWFGVNNETQTETLVTLPEVYLNKGQGYDGLNTIIPKDFSGDFENPPNVNQLRDKAQAYLNANDPRLPVNTITVNFVELSKTDEYKNVMPLQQVLLCDTVEVIFPELGIDGVRLKVIKTEWDALKEEYSSLELGDAPQTYAEAITDRLADLNETNLNLAKWAQMWASNALSIARDTDQYFWFTGTGTDTGAHITEIPKEDFLADPSNGGGNLLARSNGLAVRYGLLELATFAAAGMQIGLTSSGHTIVDAGGMRVYQNSTQLANIGYGEGSSSSGGTSTAPYFTFGTRLVNSPVGNYSSAHGRYLTASGYGSFASGVYSKASGVGSHAEGGYKTIGGSIKGSEASGLYAHAEGYSTVASGEGSHAEGGYLDDDGGTSVQTVASGRRAHAEGGGTSAPGYESHAEGRFTVADGIGTHAEGIGTWTVDNGGGHVQGKWNAKDTTGQTYADIVGAGSSDNDRKNISALTWDGDLRLKGRVYVGCEDDSTGGYQLIRRTQVAGLFSEQGVNHSNVSVPANAHTAIEGTAQRDGYYPLVISRVNSSGTGSASCPIVRFGLTSRADGSADYSVVIRNVTGTALTITVAVYIMWVKLS